MFQFLSCGELLFHFMNMIYYLHVYVYPFVCIKYYTLKE